MKRQDLKKYKLPDAPGVYFFLGKNRKILYIGRATSLRDRVKSYFSKDLAKTRGPLVEKLPLEARFLDFRKTDSVLEAILLEADLIKKFKPEFNTIDKDDKSYNCVVITKEDFPRILVIRKKELDLKLARKEIETKSIFGPFTEGGKLKTAMRIIRRILPYADKCIPLSGKKCFNAQIGLCPGVCDGSVSKSEYSKTVRNIERLFSGRKKEILRELEKDMRKQADSMEFEKAAKIRRTIAALRHINDVALISEDRRLPDGQKNAFRIEAYDVAHLGGSSRVGVMAVIEDGSAAKNEYRKFRLRVSEGGDTGGLREILERRLRHEEWPFPDIVVVDGGEAQRRVAEAVIRKSITDPKHWMSVVAVTKDEFHRPKKILGEPEIVRPCEGEILLANSEAHRFAIGYHRKLGRREAFGKID